MNQPNLFSSAAPVTHCRSCRVSLDNDEGHPIPCFRELAEGVPCPDAFDVVRWCTACACHQCWIDQPSRVAAPLTLYPHLPAT